MPKKVCSFCGRSENEVRLLITGINGFICEDCAKQAYEIIQSTGVLAPKAGEGKFVLKEVPKPVEIKNTWMNISSVRIRLSAIWLSLYITTISVCSSQRMKMV